MESEFPGNMHLYILCLKYPVLTSLNKILAVVKEEFHLQTVHQYIQYRTKILSLKGLKYPEKLRKRNLMVHVIFMRTHCVQYTYKVLMNSLHSLKRSCAYKLIINYIQYGTKF